MRRALVVGVVVVAAAAGAAGLRARAPRAEAEAPPRTSTAEVRRTDLVVSKDVTGTVGYAGTYALPNRLAGTLTSVAADGSVVVRDGVLYAVDATPVRLLYGTVPAYRPLATGTRGADVLQLERNLAALGHFRATPDERYDAATARAVRAWQDAHGETETGRVELGRVVFAPEAVRVTRSQSTVGSAVMPGPLLEATGTRRVVRVDLAVSDARLVKRGAKVSVTPPTGTDLAGTVTSVGTVARSPEGQQGSPTIEVLVTLAGSPGVLDGAPVTVALVSETRRGVLAVPVEALLALREGGFAVEVGGRLVPVETGVFADGLVEVAGDLREGDDVAVPAP